VFALGVVLYELTTGHRLFGGALESRLISCLQREEVQPPSRVVPDYPSELERICIRALRFDPEERFASAEEMRRALVRFQRSLTSDVLPEEQLTACMRDLFRDRVEEKAELLSRLRAGTGISHIPTAEVSDQVSVPVVETERNRDHLPLLAVSDDPVDVLAATSAGYDTTRGRRRGLKRRGRGLMLTAVLTILVSAGLGSLFYIADPALGARDALPQHPAQTASSGAIPTNAPVAPVPEQVAVAPVLPEQVMVELTSLPPGAGAWLDGVYQGDTPLAVVLARGTEPLSLRLQLSGHETLEQALVPDVDQRLTLSLAPSVRPQAPLRDAKPTEAKSSEEAEALSAERDQETSEKASRKKPSVRRHPTGPQTEERDEFFLFE
jgi:serine/threonine-protein kinase